jgi:hypothetical protein
LFHPVFGSVQEHDLVGVVVGPFLLVSKPLRWALNPGARHVMAWVYEKGEGARIEARIILSPFVAAFILVFALIGVFAAAHWIAEGDWSRALGVLALGFAPCALFGFGWLASEGDEVYLIQALKVASGCVDECSPSDG